MLSVLSLFNFKVNIFWEGHKILQNLDRRFDWHYIGQIYDGDFATFCGLLRIYELIRKNELLIYSVVLSPIVSDAPAKLICTWWTKPRLLMKECWILTLLVLASKKLSYLNANYISSKKFLNHCGSNEHKIKGAWLVNF